MTDAELIRIAREAGFRSDHLEPRQSNAFLRAMRAAVEAARLGCWHAAQGCTIYKSDPDGEYDANDEQKYNWAIDDVCTAIRALIEADK